MKKISEMKKKNESLFYFLRGYLLFGILLLCCILPLIIRTFFLLEENVRTNTYKNVEKGMDILDNEIAMLNNVVLDIRSHKYFPYIRSLGNERKSSDYYAFLEMKQKLMDTTRYLSFARDSMLYFPENILFLNDDVYVIEAQDSSGMLFPDAYGTLEEWFDVLDDGNYTHAFLKADKYHDTVYGDFFGIAYVHSYVYATQSENPLFVAIFPVQSLIELWRLQDLQEIARITIYNGNDEILFVDDNNKEGNSTDIIVNSKKSQLSVKVSIPNSYFISQLSELFVLIILYLVGFVLIAIVVSVRMAYRNMEKHTALNKEISHWLLREQILNGLDGKQKEEFKERYRNYPKPYRMAIIHVSNTEWSIHATEVKEFLTTHGVEYWFFSRVKPNLFVLLSTFGADSEKFRQQLEQFRVNVNQKWNCDCLISASQPQNSLEELKELYQLVLSNMKCFSEKKLLFQEDVEAYEHNDLKKLNVLENIRLTDMVLSGNENAAVNLIRNQWNTVKGVRTDAALKQLFFMQSTVLTSIAARLDYDIAALNFSFDDSISAIEEKMVGVTRELCDLVQKKKEAEKNDVPRRIIEFMKENYSDPDFYMTTLVEEFGLSDKTIAKLIKAYQNMTFSEYLEELRLQKALRLLDNPENNIRFIASASGFSSENTFFKVFKRKFGISPSNYRNNKQIMPPGEE